MDSLTVENVSARAGVSRALVFHYFPTVRDLHLACLQSAADELLAEIVRIAAESSSPGAGLRPGLEAFVDTVSAQPGTFAALSRNARVDDEFEEVFNHVRHHIVELIRVETGVASSAFITTLIHGWVAAVETSVIRWLQEPDGVERSDLLGAMEQMLVLTLTQSSAP